MPSAIVNSKQARRAWRQLDTRWWADLHYTEFHFKNFKGIRELTLDLSGDVTTLIGLNESGKTTILEAIFCFSYGAENLDVLDPGMASLRDPEQWVPIALRANFNDNIEIGATVELSATDKRQYIQHMRKEFGLRVVDVPDSILIKEVYKFENSRYVARGLSKYWTLNLKGMTGQQRSPRDFDAKSPEWQGAVAYLKDQLPKIWYFPNFLFELPDRFILTEVGSAPSNEERDKSAFYKNTFEAVLGQLGIGADLDTHVVGRLRSNEATDSRNLKSLLLDMSRVISGTILDGWNRIFGAAPAGQEVDIDAHQDQSGEAYLALKIKGPDGYYDLSERSLGFRWFFMFLLMTSYHGNGAREGQKPLFLLDEPASNLHSNAQAELLKSFESLSTTCRLVYTTHSHHLINVRWLDAAYVVKNDAIGMLTFADYLSSRTGARTSISATKYRRFVSEHPSETSYFQPVLDLLDYRPSSLEPIPNVILVEGKSDFYLLKYAVDVLGLDSDLHLIPGLGAGSLGPLIRLHVGWGKSFIVLLDGDAEGISQKARYEKEFGPILDNRCLLLPVACGDPAAKEIEDLLSRTDRVRLIKAATGSDAPTTVSKKLVLRSLLELYARRDSVEIEPGSLGRLESLLASLQSALTEVCSS